jgi:hypothetical protein
LATRTLLGTTWAHGSLIGGDGRQQVLSRSRSSWEHVAERVEHELLAVSG